MRPDAADQAEARDLAVRIAGRRGANRLLQDARAQVARIVDHPSFRRDVELIAAQLLRRHALDTDQITELLEGAEHGDQDDAGLVECICAFAFDRDDGSTQVVCAGSIWRADDTVVRSSPQYFDSITPTNERTRRSS